MSLSSPARRALKQTAAGGGAMRRAVPQHADVATPRAPGVGAQTLPFPSASSAVPPRAATNAETAARPSMGATQAQLQSQPQSQPQALELLLGLEKKARAATTRRELAFLMANETRKLNGNRQTFLLERGASGNLRLTAASNIEAIEPEAPFTRWIGRMVTRLESEACLAEAREFALPAYCEAGDAEHRTYPFKHLLWVPLPDRAGGVPAGLLFARDQAWRGPDVVISKWIGEAYAHAWQALDVRPRMARLRFARSAWHYALGIAALFAIAAIPVSMSALAPVEVVGKEPFVVAAPFDGVIDEVLVAPNAQVAAGDPLFRFVDTTLRNKHEAAERATQVAEAKYRKASQASFGESQARHEMAIAAAELALSKAERDYAKEMLAKTVVRASSAGVAVFGNKDDWKGRPVATGERVMQIAQPGDTALRIELPVKDAIVLNESAPVRIFLDTSPLRAMPGRVVHASYQAETTSTQQLAYRIRAELDDAADRQARIGARGIAQVSGARVPLAFYVLRRPITAARQFLGF